MVPCVSVPTDSRPVVATEALAALSGERSSCSAVHSGRNLIPGRDLPVQDLETPESTYKRLGSKLVVGMPFKDIATSDTLLMHQVPPKSDTAGRRALKRLQASGVHVPHTLLDHIVYMLCICADGQCVRCNGTRCQECACWMQDIGVHVIAPAGELQRDALPHAVALLPLKEAVAAHRSTEGLQLPAGAGRLVVTIDGTESEQEIASLQVPFIARCKVGMPQQPPLAIELVL